jgi:hypothetical protein
VKKKSKQRDIDCTSVHRQKTQSVLVKIQIKARRRGEKVLTVALPIT